MTSSTAVEVELPQVENRLIGLRQFLSIGVISFGRTAISFCPGELCLLEGGRTSTSSARLATGENSETCHNMPPISKSVLQSLRIGGRPLLCLWEAESAENSSLQFTMLCTAESPNIS